MKNKKINILRIKKFSILLVLSLLLLINLQHSFSQLQTMNIEGYVFLESSEGAENGVPVIVNNTNTNKIFTTNVFAPPVPELKGAYSLSIQGNLDDEVIVRAYNDTYYGETTALLTSTTTQINVTMNITRPPELNVSITFPDDEDFLNINTIMNFSVNITSLIGSVTNCEASMFISNDSILNFTSSDTNFLGAISKDEIITTLFEINTTFPGKTDVGVSVSCDENNELFIGKNSDVKYDVVVGDEEDPIINIFSPSNLSEEKASNEISFLYEVSDDSLISACYLYVNGSLNKTESNVERDVEQEISSTLPNGEYFWEIMCEDAYENIGSSGIYYLNVSVYYPLIESISVPSIINLNPGSTKNVVCEFTVSDQNGVEDIDEVFALFHLEGISDFSENKNSVYVNDSCLKISETSLSADFSCSFDLWYYANNGSWLCNVTAIDNQGLSSNNFNSTIIDKLYALNISESLIDYGDVSAGDVSEERELNVFNIGNQPLQVFVRGYGGENSEEGEGLAMICDDNENISIENHRYSVISNVFGDKLSLSSIFTYSGLTINKQDSDLEQSGSLFWQLFVPPKQVTNCAGTIVVSASG